MVSARFGKITASDPPSKNVKEAGVGRAKKALPLLAILFLSMLSNGERPGSILTNDEERTYGWQRHGI